MQATLRLFRSGARQSFELGQAFEQTKESGFNPARHLHHACAGAFQNPLRARQLYWGAGMFPARPSARMARVGTFLVFDYRPEVGSSTASTVKRTGCEFSWKRDR